MKQHQKSIKFILRETIRLFIGKDMPVYAANATLFMETAAFPLLILLLSIVRLFPNLDPNQVQRSLLSMFPDIPAVSDLLTGLLIELTEKSSAMLSWISALLAIFSSSTGIFAIMKGLQKLFGIRNVSYVKSRLLAVVYTFAFITIIILSMGTQILGNVLIDLMIKLSGYFHFGNITDSVMKTLNVFKMITSAATFLCLLLLYSCPFGYRHTFRSQLPGAILTTAGWFYASKIFAFYITYFWKVSVVYGSLSSILLISYWLFLIMCLLFIGAALNKSLMDNH